MEKRQIKMQDGRYLIFYTFADMAAAPSSVEAEENQESEQSAREPVAKPEAEEERRV